MKHITFAVPSYNSEDYLERCIESLLVGGDDVEILIINDGSKDRTKEIADEYARMYPDIVQAVHKENGGHGSGVNKGIELATGNYFKVVDSDDWLDNGAYIKLLNTIKNLHDERESPDLIVCNYVYNHLDEGIQRSMSYKNIFPLEKKCTWEDMKRFKPSQYLIMHSLIYKTSILHESGVRLPEHTFYVDNIFAYNPLPLVESIYYLDVDLYQYYIGRDDQSVNESVMMRRIDQQIKVTEIVSSSVDLQMVRMKSPKLANYMLRNISVMMAISSLYLHLISDEDSEKKRKKLWKDVKLQDKKLHSKLKYTTISGFMDLPGKLGKNISILGYKLAKNIYKFN